MYSGRPSLLSSAPKAIPTNSTAETPRLKPKTLDLPGKVAESDDGEEKKKLVFCEKIYERLHCDGLSKLKDDRK